MSLKSDVFDGVHHALRARKNALAVKMLLDDTGRIRAQFGTDINHAWYLVGEANFARKRFKEAKYAYRKALLHWPNDVDALMAIANCCSELRQHRYAIRYLKLALEMNPKSAALLFNLGNAQFDIGDFRGALKSYRKAERFAGSDRTLAKMVAKNATLAASIE
jgi:tetratricopeptide (TPR) repeat protein